MIRAKQRLKKPANGRFLLARDPVVRQIPAREAECRVDVFGGKVVVFLFVICLAHSISFLPTIDRIDPVRMTYFLPDLDAALAGQTLPPIIRCLRIIIA